MVLDSHIVLIIMLCIVIITMGVLALFAFMSSNRRSDLRLKVGSPKLLVLDISIKIH